MKQLSFHVQLDADTSSQPGLHNGGLIYWQGRPGVADVGGMNMVLMSEACAVGVTYGNRVQW